VRGAYGTDGSATGFSNIAAAGFNSVMTSPFREDLDRLQAAGLKGIVWLGQGFNTTCQWEYDDQWIRSHVGAVAGHPAILAYYLGDEPSAHLCPQAPAAYRARTALVRSIDPQHPTFTVLQVSDHGDRFAYAAWRGAVDILGFDVYPCNVNQSGCDFSKIDQAIAAASEARITTYWAVIQDFQDDFYRLPTPAQVAAEFAHWDRSAMSGYLVFSWHYKAVTLDSQPANVAQLRAENAQHGAT
jgi:hypothetical protein